MLPRWITERVRRHAHLILCASLMLSAVCGDPVGPRMDPDGLRAALSFAPEFPAGAGAALKAAAIDVDNVHIVLTRANGTVVLDTIVQFPVGVNEISFEASVVVRGGGEQLSALIQLRSGSVTLFEGTQQIEARAGLTTPQTVAITTHYAGPGATATRVTLAPRSLPLTPGATVQLAASVTDAAGTVFAGVPLAWTSSDPTVATVSATGLVTALNKRGSTNLVVSTLSGLTDQVSASVTLPPSVSRVVSGGGQTGRVGASLPQPLVIEVAAADGVPSPGVAVAFRAVSPNATISPSTGTTDATGRVSATMTLGGGIGSQAFEATATGLPAVSVSATASAGLPTHIVVVSGSGQSDTAGKALALPFVVRVTDDFGNALPGIVVAWTRDAGSGAVAAPTSVTDAAGQASMTYTLGSSAGSESILASISGASAIFSATALARPPTDIIATTATSHSGAVGTTGPTLGVQVLNALGQPVPGVLVSWVASGQASVESAGTVTGADGRAFNQVRYATTVGSATIVASFGGSPHVQFDLTAVAGPPTQFLLVEGEGQTAAAGSAVPVRPAVRVLDAYNNPVSARVFFAVSGGGGTITDDLAPTDADGVARVGSWTLGPAGPQSLTASYDSFSIVFTARSTPVGPPKLAIAVQPNATQQSGSPFSTSPRVQLEDFAGTPLTTAGVPVTVALASVAQTLGGTLTVNTNSSGIATFTGLSVTGSVGSNQLVFSATGYTGATSTTFTLTAGAPSQLVALTPTSLNGAVGSPASPVPAVALKDVSGNPIAGQTVTFAAASSLSGTVAGGSAVTDANGAARPTSWTFDARPGKDTLFASFASVSGSPVAFVATTTVGSTTQLIVISGDGQTGTAGQPLAAPLVVEARDASNNLVAGATVTFAVTGGGGLPATQNVVTGPDGRASFTWTLGSVGPQSLTATVGSVSAALSATSTAAGPPQLAVIAQPNATQQNATAFTTHPQVQLKDNAGSLLTTAGVPVTVSLATAGQTLGGTLTVVTNSSGIAVFTDLSIQGTVGNNQMVFASSGYTSATSASFTITAGVASQLTAVTATTLSGTVGGTASPTPTVTLTDVSGNPVAGQTISFTPASATSGVVSGGSVATNSSGTASPASWTFHGTPGKDTLFATYAGANGSPLAFIATTISGAATQLVIISGNNQTGITGQPLAAPLIVEARDGLSNPVSGVVVGFTVTSGGGTPTSQSVTTSSDGRASFSWTMGPIGSQSVQACLPSCSAQVAFTALAIPVGADAVWAGSTSTDWSTPANWNPAVVPSTSSKVFVPSGTTFAPALSTNGTLVDLTMASGTTLSLGTNSLSLSGSLLAAGATVSGTGTVTMSGSGKQLAGAMPSLVVAGGSTTVSGTTTINGNLTISGSSIFDAGAATTTITGALTTVSSSSGRLKMTNAAARIIVGGDAYFNAIDMGDGDLTAGVLEVKGNFTAERDRFQAFRATGTHITRFSGSAAQAIYFYYAADDRSRFQNVEFANAAGIVLNSPTVAAGNATVSGNTALTGGRLWVGELLTTASGTSLAGLSDVVVYSGNGLFPLMSGVAPPALYLSTGSTVNAPAGSTTLPGALIVNSATTLDIGANTLTVNGALTYANSSSARLRMNHPSGRLIVKGDAYFNAVDMGDADLTAGVLELRGNVTVERDRFQSFRANGSHLTRLNGTTPQAVYFYYSRDDRSRFQHLELSNAAGITFNSEIVARGDVAVLGASALSGGRLWVGGLLSSVAGTSMAGIADAVIYASGVFPLMSGVAPPALYLSTGTVVNAPSGSTTLPGALIVNSGTILDIGASTLTINGALTYASSSEARLRMTNAAGQFIVKGDAYFNAADMGDNDLTAGTLEFRGNLTVERDRFQSFRATGSHLTRLNGTALQSVYFYYGRDDRSRFANLEMSNPAGVVFASEVVVGGNVALTGTTPVSGGRLWTGGLLTSAAGTSLAAVSDVVVYSNGVFPLMAGVAPPALYLSTGTVVTAPAGSTILPGALVVNSGTTLDIGANTLTVNGALTYASSSNARLRMNDASGRLIVKGDAYFNAADMGENDLTAGVLELRGNLTVERDRFQSFRATGSHTTKINGTSAQAIYFYYGRDDRSRFMHVEFANAAGVTFNSEIVAAGNATVSGTTGLTGGRLWVGAQLTTAATTSLSALADVVIYSGTGTFPLVGGGAPPALYLATGTTISVPAGSTVLPGNLIVNSGTVLDIGAHSLTVNGSLTYSASSNARLRMNDAAGRLTVKGDAYFNAADMGDGDLTAGILEVRGNFTAERDRFQSFRATGTHLTKFTGTAAQAIYFYYALDSRSRFQNLEMANSSAAGITVNSSIYTGGNMAQLGRLATGSSLSIGGALSLGATSNTTATGGVSSASCTAAPGATYTGFTCGGVQGSRAVNNAVRRP